MPVLVPVVSVPVLGSTGIVVEVLALVSAWVALSDPEEPVVPGSGPVVGTAVVVGTSPLLESDTEVIPGPVLPSFVPPLPPPQAVTVNPTRPARRGATCE
jgi:hypothetical protein